jgi:hypothetical protein
MAVLSRFIDQFIQPKSSIDCPKMLLVTGGGVQEVCFEGSGEIRMPTTNKFEFVMHGRPAANRRLTEIIRRARNRKFEATSQLKLIAHDYRRHEWNCGYVNILIGDSSCGIFRLEGEISSLSTTADPRISGTDSGIEVVYDRPLRLPMKMNMTTQVHRAGKDVFLSHRDGEHELDVLGTRVKFAHDPEKEIIWATADTSNEFGHPYAENWISEPLSMLLGELVYPRLVARKFGGGRGAYVWIRRAPGRPATTLFASLLEKDPVEAGGEFWALYRDLLTLIATSKGKDGHPNFGDNALTRYYLEIIQSSSATNWVMCMTLSGVIEGVLRLLVPKEEWRSGVDGTELQKLRDHVLGWDGDVTLRGKLLESVSLLARSSPTLLLAKYCSEGGFGREHIQAWRNVRNQVMHGNLVSPWMDEDLEVKMTLLTELAHRLSKVYLRRFLIDQRGGRVCPVLA